MTSSIGQMAFSGGGIVRKQLPDDGPGSFDSLARRDDAGILPVWRGKPLVDRGGSLCWLDRHHACLQAIDETVFLGLQNNSPRFAVDMSSWSPDTGIPERPDSILDRTEQCHPDAPKGSKFSNLRSLIGTLDEADSELAAIAKSLLLWHSRHRHCANCGSPCRMIACGWQRKCESCSTIHFCRTDPVVIMLVTSGNSVLLGRAHGWPDRMHSLLAGYMEPGETIEAAVRRETFEETGIKVGRVAYVASQPWPFPSSLMIGCIGSAESTEIALDRNELEGAAWLTREEMKDAFFNPESPIAPPRHGSIAAHLIWLWLSGRVG